MCQAGSGLGGLRTMDTAQILDVGVDKAAGKWGWAFTLKTHLQEKMVTHFPALGVRVGCAGCCSPCKSGFFPSFLLRQSFTILFVTPAFRPGVPGFCFTKSLSGDMRSSGTSNAVCSSAERWRRGSERAERGKSIHFVGGGMQNGTVL